MRGRINPEEWCVVDLETTGLYPGRHDRVVEIAVVIANSAGNPIREWHSLVNPGRDLGPTRIHRINANQTNQAPSFSELVGDILKFFHGRRLVAHNASFDTRFLEAEFKRAGVGLAPIDTLCTMQVASSLGIGRKLEICCAATGIENTAPHTALGDARATAELLSYFLRLERREKGLTRKASIPDPFLSTETIEPSGKSVHREEATILAKPSSYLSKLAGKLPTPSAPTGASQQAVASYTDLLDRVLEDRIVTGGELKDLEDLANELSLGTEQLQEINLYYIKGLVAIALSDNVVTEAERSDLDRAAALLGIHETRLESLISREEPADPPSGLSEGSEFEGKTVCFTGSSNCMVNGERLTRGIASEVATAAGLKVEKSVTKRLDILVVADPETQSSKAKRARDNGTRIIAERSFWPGLGVTID